MFNLNSSQEFVKDEPFIYLFQADLPPQRLRLSELQSTKLTQPPWHIKFWLWLTADLYSQISENGWL